MHRRNTLGPLSPSHLNSRTGGAGRPSLKGDAEPHKARRSLAPKDAGRASTTDRRHSQERRSSIYSKNAKADARPISDRSWQQQAIRAIVACLNRLGYEPQVSAKTLTLPSAKDFNSITRFMIDKFDPNLKIDPSQKLEEELPFFLRTSGYPFQLSKSSLVTVGAPHTWPHMLAALLWLADGLTYADRADQDVPGADNETWESIELATEMEKMYDHYIHAEDLKWEARRDELVQKSEDDKKELEAELEQQQQEVQRREEEVRYHRTKPGPVQMARDTLLLREENEGKFDQALRNTLGALKALERKMAEAAEDASAKASQLSGLEQEVEELEAQVRAQPYNKADVEKMMRTREKYTQKLGERQWKLQQLQESSQLMADKWEKHVAVLRGQVKAYNELAYRLRIIPENAKRANGMHLSMQLQMDSPDIINLDVKAQITPLLEKIERELDGKLHDALRGKMEAASELSRETSKVEDMQKKIVKLNQQVQEASERCEKVLAEKQRVMQQKAHDKKDLQEDCSSLGAALQGDLESRERQCALLERELEEVKRHCDDQLAAAKQSLAKAREMAKAAKAHWLAESAATAQQAREFARSVDAMPLIEAPALLLQHRVG